MQPRTGIETDWQPGTVDHGKLAASQIDKLIDWQADRYSLDMVSVLFYVKRIDTISVNSTFNLKKSKH